VGLMICFIFLTVLVVIYGFLLKKMTPISLFIMIAFCYGSFPILFSSFENEYTNSIANRYQLFNIADMEYGILLLLGTMSILLIQDWFLIKKIILLSEHKSPSDLNKLMPKKWILKIIILISFVLFCLGVFMYGIDHFLYGYSDGDIGTNYSSPGASLISFADILFFVSAGMLTKIKNTRSLILIILFYSFLHFLGGARLMTMIGLLMIVIVHNKFIFNITRKTLIYTFSAIGLFVIIGASRGNGFNILSGFMEFYFVGLGYYNIIAIRPVLDAYLIDFIKDLFIYAMPAFIDKSLYISKSAIILSMFSDEVQVSPLGGYFFMSDMYLYLGVFAPFVTIIIFYIYTQLILYYYIIYDSKYSLIYSFFVALMCSFAMVNMLRNGILPASSAVFKSVVISSLLLVLFKGFTFRSKKISHKALNTHNSS
jgi:hypothetical protein